MESLEAGRNWVSKDRWKIPVVITHVIEIRGVPAELIYKHKGRINEKILHPVWSNVENFLKKYEPEGGDK